LVRKKVGEVETPFTLEGLRIHEEEASRVLKGIEVREAKGIETVHDLMLMSRRNLVLTLKVRGRLANPKDRILFATVLPCGVFGKPDMADCTNGKQPVIVEMKTKNELPMRDSPWSSDELQVAAYMMGLEELGFEPSYGTLAYVLRSDPAKQRQFSVTLTEELRRKVLLIAESVRRIIDGSQEPVPPDSVNKCRVCPEKYRTACPHRLC
jgi:CRISPR/Cas system-associated exonuclease Cas4 (RecB family)